MYIYIYVCVCVCIITLQNPYERSHVYLWEKKKLPVFFDLLRLYLPHFYSIHPLANPTSCEIFVLRKRDGVWTITKKPLRERCSQFSSSQQVAKNGSKTYWGPFWNMHFQSSKISHIKTRFSWFFYNFLFSLLLFINFWPLSPRGFLRKELPFSAISWNDIFSFLGAGPGRGWNRKGGVPIQKVLGKI